MKKILVILMAFLFITGVAFAQDDDIWGDDSGSDDIYGDDYSDDGGGQSVYFQAGAGLMYIMVNGVDYFDLFALRGGVHGDILFSLGMFEIGAELGLYTMQIDSIWGSILILEVPMDVLARINFDSERTFAFELKAGGWLEALLAGGAAADFGFNVGGRFVISYFYIGADYIFMDPGGLAIEIGAKMSF